MVTCFWLDEFGYAYELVNNGEEALKAFRANPFPVVLMNIKMEKMDGYEATKSIREFEKDNGLKPCIIIALTAQALLGDKEKCLTSGMNEYFSKPIDYSAFKHCLARYMLK